MSDARAKFRELTRILRPDFPPLRRRRRRTRSADRDAPLRPRLETLGGRLLEKPLTPGALRDAIREALAPRPVS